MQEEQNSLGITLAVAGSSWTYVQTPNTQHLPHSKMHWAHLCADLHEHVFRILLLTSTELHQLKSFLCGRRARSSVTTNSTGQSHDLIFRRAGEQKLFSLQSCHSSMEIPSGFERTHRDVPFSQLCNCLLQQIKSANKSC